MTNLHDDHGLIDGEISFDRHAFDRMERMQQEERQRREEIRKRQLEEEQISTRINGSLHRIEGNSRRNILELDSSSCFLGSGTGLPDVGLSGPPTQGRPVR